MELSGVSAVVTGGASGLGEATARALADAGARVALFDLNAERAEAIAAEIRGVACHVDVADEGSVDAAFARARGAIGQERILINCAGIGDAKKTAGFNRATGAPEHFPLATFELIVRVNLVGTFRCIAKSAAGMLTLDPLPSGERGAIVSTASVAAEDGQLGQAAYSASKAGVVGMTLPIARDLSTVGIRVNTILPGFFATPMVQQQPDKVRNALIDSVPFPKRPGDPREYASLALEMCRNAYFNGEDVRLDGAIRMSMR